MNSTPPRISVVMVTLNEAGAIAKVVGELRRVVAEAEVVVVDSTSDSTAEIAEQLGCRVKRQIPPAGYGPAMHEGLTTARGEIIVTLDCDDTYPIESIPQMVSKIDEGYDLVNASRLKGKPAAMSLPNYLANWTFARIAAWLCGVKITDVHSGMRAYRRTLLEKLSYDPVGMALPVELLVAPYRLGYKCTEIFIGYR